MAEMGRQELIGEGENQLIPHYKQGEEELEYVSHRRKNSDKAHQKRVEQRAGNKPKPVQTQVTQTGRKVQGNQPKKGTMLTQHTGLPPRISSSIKSTSNKKSKK